MPYSNRDVSKDKIPSRRTIILVFVCLTIMLAMAYYFQIERERKLKNTTQAKAIIKSVRLTTRGGATVNFNVMGKKIEAHFSGGDFKFLEQGDTILIKYANEDPKLVEVVDKYYMVNNKN